MPPCCTGCTSPPTMLGILASICTWVYTSLPMYLGVYQPPYYRGCTSLPTTVGVLASLCTTRVYVYPCTPWVYVPLRTPWVYLQPQGEPGQGTRQHVRDELTALSRRVTEQTVSDEPLTVASRIPFYFPVSLLVSSWPSCPISPHLAVGREVCCADRPLPVHHPFHCWACILPSRTITF